MPWLTPNYGTGFVARSIFIPSFLLSHFTGALQEMTISENWQSFGDMSPEECAIFAGDMLLSVRGDMVGQVFYTLGDIPGYGLPLDGAVRLRSNYPALWGVLPLAMKTETTFTLPDFSGRFVLSGGTIGELGGESEHVLTIDEMPPHEHGEHTHLPVQATGEIPTAIPDVPIPDVTTLRGGGLPHNNMPPYVVVRPFVVAF